MGGSATWFFSLGLHTFHYCFLAVYSLKHCHVLLTCFMQAPHPLMKHQILPPIAELILFVMHTTHNTFPQQTVSPDSFDSGYVG
jgi:hypothetical protein